MAETAPGQPTTDVNCWRPARIGYLRENNVLRCQARMGESTPIQFLVQDRPGAGPVVTLTLGSLFLTYDRQTEVADPRVEAVRIHEPKLLADLALDSSVGASLAIQLEGDAQRLSWDVRVNTQLQVENVGASLTMTGLPVGYWLLPSPATSWAPSRANRMAAWPLPSGEWGYVFLDLGETGSAAPQTLCAGANIAEQLELRLFDCPLEKGVLLVGRTAFGVTEAAPNPLVRLEQLYADWSATPSSL